jgi:hypothetical protein
MCVALLTVTVVTASDKPKLNPNITRVKQDNHPINIDRSAGNYVNGNNKRVISSASRNNRIQPASQPPKAKNPNS